MRPVVFSGPEEEAMLSKKYIFETKSTFIRRKFLAFMLTVIVLLGLYIGACLTIITIASSENDKAAATFYQRTPDLIVIYTGDSGRIPFGLRKALEYQLPHVLITGVHNPNSVRSILQRQDKNLLKKIDLDSYIIEIDYTARNTIENVLSTLNYLRKKGGIKSILIISSDYHILRIKMILRMLTAPTDRYQFFFMNPPTDYRSWRNIRLILTEVFKSFKAFLFLVLWDYEAQFTG